MFIIIFAHKAELVLVYVGKLNLIELNILAHSCALAIAGTS